MQPTQIRKELFLRSTRRHLFYYGGFHLHARTGPTNISKATMMVSRKETIMVGADLEKIILIFDLSIKARRSENFVSFFGQTGLMGVQWKRPITHGLTKIRC